MLALFSPEMLQAGAVKRLRRTDDIKASTARGGGGLWGWGVGVGVVGGGGGKPCLPARDPARKNGSNLTQESLVQWEPDSSVVPYHWRRGNANFSRGHTNLERDRVGWTALFNHKVPSRSIPISCEVAEMVHWAK